MLANEFLIDALLEMIPNTITRLSEARNFISKGMIKINGKIITNEHAKIKHGDILEVGKRFKLTI